MSWFRMNALSVGSLTTTILLGVMTAYLLGLRHRGRETWYLTGYFGSLFLLLFAYTARYSVFSPAALATAHIANLIVFGAACLIQFAYWFGGNPYRRESVVVLIASLAAASAVWGSLFLPGRHPPLYAFYAEYFTYDFGPSVGLLAMAEYLWALVVFLRRATRFDDTPGGEARSRLYRLIHPADRTARSHRSFALLTLATLPFALPYVVNRTGLVSRATFAIAFNSGALLICLLIFMIYVANAPRPTRFVVKLVGVPLAVVLVAFGIAANAIMPLVERTIMDRYRAEADLAVAALETQQLWRLPRDVVYLLPTTAELDALRFGASPAYRPSELLLRAFPGTHSAGGSPLVARFHYSDLYDPTTYFFSFPLYYRGELFRVGFSYGTFRRELHEVAWRLAAVALLSCLIVVAGFPLFFRRGLFTPLSALLSAVRRVSHGNFSESLAVLSDDEIGQLAQGYNRMIEALRSMEGNFKALAENAHDAILIISPEGEVLFTNARGAALAGLPAGDLPGRRLESLLGDGKASGLLRGFTDGRHGAARSVALETRLRRAGGALVPVELSAAATEWQGTAAVVVVARDVSERKQAEELLRIQQLKLMRSDKLASLGELVAGVAHEVNNPNQVVSMGARFLEEATPRLLALAESSAELDEELRLAGRPYREFKRAYIQAITDIEASSNRIDHIVRELKGYVRGGESHHLPLDLNEVALSVVDLTRSIVEKAGASLQLELCDSRLEVVGDFVELEQVVLNLIENACQALPDGGGAIMLSTWSMEGRACLCVRDTGSGVSADDLAHLTEPFFTTRAECGGSGLGLSIVNRIVQGHGGELEIESQPGRGTSVTVRIPCAGKSGGL